jgi:threonine aspartase 1
MQVSAKFDVTRHNVYYFVLLKGAGMMSECNKPSYRAICEKASLKGIDVLKKGKNAIYAVAEAIAVLEDDPLTNAGTGSNLCFDGTIECDASLMNGHNLNWASVGALSRIKNPIYVPKLLLKEQEFIHPLSLIPPITLVGEGARKWAVDKGLELSELTSGLIVYTPC